jgi:glycosyltransferase involved in cell wall biosynthesis
MGANSAEVSGGEATGINLIGFLEAESGLGEIARRLARATEHARLPLAAVSYRNTPVRQQHDPPTPIASGAPYDTNIVCLNADDLIEFVDDVGASFFSRRYSIGVWFWETTVFDRGRLVAARFLDELWVASEFVRAAIEPYTDLPVHVVPVPIEEPPETTLTRAELGLPDGFMFLFVFDFVSSERKNPDAVVEAYTRAFSPDDGSVLVLKSVNGRERKPKLLERLVSTAAGRPDIVIRDGYVSSAERDAFMAACDCYVSLHRSEGFGLTIAEAMSYGKPVIATGYSGNLEFMTARSSLVDSRLVPVPESWWAYQPGAMWAEPDVDDASARMRAIFDDQERARRTAADARAALVTEYSLERTARFITERFENGRASAALSSRTRSSRAQLGEVSSALSGGVDTSLRRGGRGFGGFARRLLARLLWPELAERHRVESSLLDVLVHTQRSLESLERRIVELEVERAAREAHED